MPGQYAYLAASDGIPAGGCSRCGGEFNLLDLGIIANPFVFGKVTLCGTCLGELIGALGLIPESRAAAENEALMRQVTSLGEQIITLESALAVARADLDLIPTDGIIREFTDGITTLANDLAARVRDAAASVSPPPAAVAVPAPADPAPAADAGVPEPTDDVDGGGDEDGDVGDDEAADGSVAATDVFAFLHNIGVDTSTLPGADDAAVEGPDGVPGADGSERNSDEQPGAAVL